MHGVGKFLESAARSVDRPQRGLRNPSRDQPVAFPGILAQLAHAFGDLDGGAQLDRVEPGLVDLRRDRDHHAGPHVKGPETLLPVAQRGVDKPNLVHRALRLHRAYHNLTPLRAQIWHGSLSKSVVGWLPWGTRSRLRPMGTCHES